jgi:hypothetical protein
VYIIATPNKDQHLYRKDIEVFPGTSVSPTKTQGKKIVVFILLGLPVALARRFLGP